MNDKHILGIVFCVSIVMLVSCDLLQYKTGLGQGGIMIFGIFAGLAAHKLWMNVDGGQCPKSK